MTVVDAGGEKFQFVDAVTGSSFIMLEPVPPVSVSVPVTECVPVVANFSVEPFVVSVSVAVDNASANVTPPDEEFVIVIALND